MKLTQSLTIAALLSGSALIAAPANSAPIPAVDCAETVVFQVDGTKGPGTPTSVDPASPLNRIAERYRVQVNVQVIEIAYPGTVVPVEPWGAMPYDDSVAQGMQALDREFTEMERDCPYGVEYIILGYSQGARIAGDFLERVDRGDYGPVQDRVTGELYSDPREGLEAYFPGELAPGITLTGPRPSWRKVAVRTNCLPGDPVCGYRPGDDPMTALQGYFHWHTQYGR